MIPEAFKPKVLGWLGGNMEYFKETQSQTITSVYNVVTDENTGMVSSQMIRPPTSSQYPASSSVSLPLSSRLSFPLYRTLQGDTESDHHVRVQCSDR